IAADYPKGNQKIVGGQIKIWVKGPIDPSMEDMVLNSTAGPNQKLQIAFRNNTHFDIDSNCSGHRRNRRKYSESNAGLFKVSVLTSSGTELKIVETNIPMRKEIDRILIWTD